MPYFFDIHSHMLCGVDDGAKSREEMIEMLEAAYRDGTRALCLTPHYSPYHFGETLESSEAAFRELSEYAGKVHPDMKLYLGHELGYHSEGLQALQDGRCRSLAGGRYVLVDFPEAVSFFEVRNAMDKILRFGYIPVLAHTERYRDLRSHMDWIEEFVSSGGVVQINASSVTGGWGMAAKGFWKKLVHRHLAAVIASDGHNTTTRRPEISVCMEYLRKHCDPEYIRDLVWENPCRIIANQLL